MTARLQGLVGDVKSDEGSLDGAAMHGVVGCLAPVAADGNCGAAIVAAAGSEFATGLVNRHTGDSQQTVEIISRYVLPAMAAVTSGGQVVAFDSHSAITNSQL